MKETQELAEAFQIGAALPREVILGWAGEVSYQDQGLKQAPDQRRGDKTQRIWKKEAHPLESFLNWKD